MTRVTLLTDFGTADGYAAAMAGVIAAGAPDAAIEHASHDVEQGDIFGAALTLSRYATLYPPGTVHVVVVDPGVGTARRPLAARIDGRSYVAPDNGVLGLVLAGAADVRIVEITSPGIVDGASATFHGRDIFAPAAARLARGDALDALGSMVDDPESLTVPEPRRHGTEIRGRVLHVDGFGNLISNIPAGSIGVRAGVEHPLAVGAGAAPDAPLSDDVEVVVADTPVGPVRRTYGDVESGEVVALVGSIGLLEVSVRDGSAASRLGADRGTPVTVRG